MTDTTHGTRPRVDDEPLHGRSALVLGLGRFSGGVETVRFLAAQGVDVVVSDTAPAESLVESRAAIASTGARTVFGPQTPSLLDGLPPGGFVVASPAIPFDHPVLVEAARRGIPTSSEIELFLARVKVPVLAVTGTKGKSTTATLLANMLRASGLATHLGGNVGRSLLNELGGIGPRDVVVLELSSFQLESLRGVGFAPRVAVVTNLFPDHLDRHGTFQAYGRSKRVLLESQGPGDVAVLPARDDAVKEAGFLEAGRAGRLWFGDAPIPGPGVCVTRAGGLADEAGRGGTMLEGFSLWGGHNRLNAAAAAAAARAMGAPWAEVAAGAAATPALRHRLEPVHQSDGLLFVDDSIATTPQSAAAALHSVPRPCVILVGGKDKGADPAPLFEAIREKARAVVGIGTTGEALVAEVLRRRLAPAVRGGPGPDLSQSVAIARGLAKDGDAILLSPGYSSLDQYASFAVRGDEFARAARARESSPRE